MLPPTEGASLEKLLLTLKVIDLVPEKQQVVVIPADSTIEDAFKVPNINSPPSSALITPPETNSQQVLSSARVLSAPVLDNNGEYVGLVDM